ncbi:delta-60 repeat domain-containing protein [Nocardiopsis lambiniae]|uniref:Delta-60 repeat domain-containing protein n=1 Tax=Nocardiopsis lambiniae TaxID=3075539 RepID=A0ABU2M5D4_9ACTN|nr:delta-60 repeat domain-containing protein [Nocardiopsis sp. DSM 44743]MDT0327216.1 delta-60 repeat domain-containing protein [Nocardiopsis sp. DSM 44743]
MKPKFTALALGMALLAAIGAPTPALAGDTAHRSVVSERPVRWTPHVLDGAVKDIVRVGNVVIVAGGFGRVAEADRDYTHELHNIFAFEHGTGRIIHDFTPRVNGTVNSVVPGPDGTVVIGGEFRAVNGTAARGLARLRLFDGSRVAAFTTTVDGGVVHRLATDGSRLYVGGSFRGIGGTARPAIARLNPVTGAVDPGFSPVVSEQRRGGLRVQELALSPDGRRLVINGTFTKVNGQSRYQIAMLDTATGRPTRWSTKAFEPECDYSAMHTYMRQMDFAPDGSYFALVTAGGPQTKPGLCKAVVRFENNDTANSTPTWSNKTGGDSLYSVEVTGAAVYAGGHQRWMDNEQGALNPGPGSVAREGIAAVDPRTGRALAWNPGRTRGHGVEAMHATPDGLYVGSDTERLAGEYHARLGMFPIG